MWLLRLIVWLVKLPIRILGLLLQPRSSVETSSGSTILAEIAEYIAGVDLLHDSTDRYLVTSKFNAACASQDLVDYLKGDVTQFFREISEEALVIAMIYIDCAIEKDQNVRASVGNITHELSYKKIPSGSQISEVKSHLKVLRLALEELSDFIENYV